MTFAPRVRRAAVVGAAVLFVGLSLSAYLAIIGYHPLEAVRFGRANAFLYALDRGLNLPARLVVAAGDGGEGIPFRVCSVLGSALFWGAAAGAFRR